MRSDCKRQRSWQFFRPPSLGASVLHHSGAPDALPTRGEHRCCSSRYLPVWWGVSHIPNSVTPSSLEAVSASAISFSPARKGIVVSAWAHTVMRCADALKNVNFFMLLCVSTDHLICKLSFDSRQKQVIARGVCVGYACLCSGDVRAVKS